MLTALVQKRHDDVDSVGLAGGSRNNSLQILIVVVRGHVVFAAADRVGLAVIGNVNHDIKVGAPYGFPDIAFAFSGSKTDTFAFHQEGFLAVALRDDAELFL